MAAVTAVRAVSSTLGSLGVTYSSGEEAPRKPVEEEIAAYRTVSRSGEDEREHVEETGPSFSGWTRGDRMVEILIRPETLQLIQGIEGDQDPDMLREFPFASKANLHTFAALVSEDLLSLDDGSLVLTPLAKRLIEEVAELH